MLVGLDEEELFGLRSLSKQTVTQNSRQISNKPNFYDFSEADMEDLMDMNEDVEE